MGSKRSTQQKHSSGQHFLVRQGGALRTFGGFVLSSSAISLVLGLYLIVGVLSHPFGDPTAPLLGGALLVAGGFIALVSLLGVVMKRHQGRLAEKVKKHVQPESAAERKTATASQQRVSSQLPFQRLYVDSTRIRP